MDAKLVQKSILYFILSILVLFNRYWILFTISILALAGLIIAILRHKNKKKLLHLYLKINFKKSILLVIQYLIIILVLTQLQYASLQTSTYFAEQYDRENFDSGHILIRKQLLSNPEGIGVQNYGELKKYMPTNYSIQLQETEDRFEIKYTFDQIYYLNALISWKLKYPTTLENTDNELLYGSDSFDMIILTDFVRSLLEFPDGLNIDDGLFAFEVNKTIFGEYDYFQLGNLDTDQINLTSSKSSNTRDVVAKVKLLQPSSIGNLLDITTSIGISTKKLILVSPTYLESILKPASIPVGDYFSSLSLASVMYFSSDNLYGDMDRGMEIYLTKDLSSLGFEIIKSEIHRLYTLQKDLKTRYDTLISYLTSIVYLILGLSLFRNWMAYASRKEEIFEFYSSDGYDVKPLEDSADLFETYIIHVPGILLLFMLGLSFNNLIPQLSYVLSLYFVYIGLVSIVFSFAGNKQTENYRYRMNRPLALAQKFVIILLVAVIVLNMVVDKIPNGGLGFLNTDAFIFLEPILLILFVTIALGDAYRKIVNIVITVVQRFPGHRYRKTLLSLKYINHISLKMGAISIAISVGAILLSLLLLTSSVQQIHVIEIRGDLGGDMAIDFANNAPDFLDGQKGNLSVLDNVESLMTIAVIEFTDYVLSEEFGTEVRVTLIAYNMSELRSFSTPNWNLDEELDGFGENDIQLFENSIYTDQIISEGSLNPRNPSVFGKNFFTEELDMVRVRDQDPEDVWGSYWITQQLDGLNVPDRVNDEESIRITGLISMVLANRIIELKSSFLKKTILTLNLQDIRRTRETVNAIEVEIGYNSEISIYSIPPPEKLTDASSILYPLLQTQFLLISSIIPVGLLSLYQLYTFASEEALDLMRNSLQNNLVLKKSVSRALLLIMVNYVVLTTAMNLILSFSFSNAFRFLLLSSRRYLGIDFTRVFIEFGVMILISTLSMYMGFRRQNKEMIRDD